MRSAHDGGESFSKSFAVVRPPLRDGNTTPHEPREGRYVVHEVDELKIMNDALKVENTGLHHEVDHVKGVLETARQQFLKQEFDHDKAVAALQKRQRSTDDELALCRSQNQTLQMSLNERTSQCEQLEVQNASSLEAIRVQVMAEGERYSAELEGVQKALEKQKRHNSETDNLLNATLRKHYEDVTRANEQLQESLNKSELHNVMLNESVEAAATQLEDYHQLQQQVTRADAKMQMQQWLHEISRSKATGLCGQLRTALDETAAARKTLAEMKLVLKALTSHNEQLEAALAAANELVVSTSPSALARDTESRSRQRRSSSGNNIALQSPVKMQKHPGELAHGYSSPSQRSPMKATMSPLEQHAAKQLAKRTRQLHAANRS